MNRRCFLGFAGSLLYGASGDARRERLACNSWPFRAYFDAPQLREFRDAKYPLLQQWDFPQFLADELGIHNVEFLPQHFKDTDSRTIEKVKAALASVHSRCCNLMGVELPDGAEAAMREGRRWMDVAQALGSPSITIALVANGPMLQKLKPVVDVAAQRGIRVLFHNDDIKRETAEILTGLVRELGTAHAGTCPDFGNFAVRSKRYALDQLKMLAPFASNICHAKDGIADNGKFYADDFAASMQVMKQTGFGGVYSLEFEGLGEPLPGVRKLMELTLRNL